MIPKELEEPKELMEAFEMTNQMSWTKEELDAYEARGIYIQDERGRVEYALVEGEKIGIKKGKKENAKETAKKMLDDGLSIETISKYTGLPAEEINKLKE
jgi:predicted transposase/invertase (TIGR01784 family)